MDEIKEEAEQLNMSLRTTRFNIRSVGLSPKSDRQIKQSDIEWAALIIVMEQGQRSRISDTYRHLQVPDIEVLQIEDEYEYLEPYLIEMLTDRINSKLLLIFNI